MPGIFVASVSDSLRKDHNNIPFINIVFDGQDSVSVETRLQAFAFQVKEFATHQHVGNGRERSLQSSSSLMKH